MKSVEESERQPISSLVENPCNTAQRKQSTNANKFNKFIKQMIPMIIFLMINSSDLISQFSPIIVH